MASIKGKLALILIIFSISWISTACGSADDVDPDVEITADAEIVSEPTPTNTPKPTPTPAPTATPTPQPTATNLPTEIIEPLSPVSPITSTEELAMRLADSSVQPIPGSEEALTAAVKDLSEQIEVAPEEITLISIEAMEWSDSSLGCPQEGFMYAQVITPGYLIVLKALGQQYEYHTDQGSNVILCQEE